MQDNPTIPPDRNQPEFGQESFPDAEGGGRDEAVPASYPVGQMRAPVTVAQRTQPERSRATPVLLFLALMLEIGTVLVMTWMRYRFQLLDPEFFDFSKTANLYGLILILPFIVIYLIGIFFRRFHRPYIGLVAFLLSLIGIALLGIVTTTTRANQPTFAVAFLALKAFSLGLMLILFRTTPRPVWKDVLGVTLYSLVFALGAYLMVVASILIDPITPSPAEHEARTEYDAGVILGAAVWSGNRPSPVFRERIRKGYELLTSGKVEFLVLTGGNAPNELTEAEVGKRELLKLGADPTRIVLEDKTSSTVEQILFIRNELLTTQRWTSFIIISDQFHLKRALEICAFNDITANGIASESPLGPYSLAIYHLRESAALILYWMFGL